VKAINVIAIVVSSVFVFDFRFRPAVGRGEKKIGVTVPMLSSSTGPRQTKSVDQIQL